MPSDNMKQQFPKKMEPQQDQSLACSSKILPVEVVDMSSELPDDEENEPANWPETAHFQTIAENVVEDRVPAIVKKAIELGKLPQNKICCSCKTNCFENKNCECYKTADTLSKLVRGKILKHGDQIFPGRSKNAVDYWNRFRFVCGEGCACLNTCNMKALRDVSKNQRERFKVIRIPDGKGFRLITKVDIKRNTPVILFPGELCSSNLTETEVQYVLQITGSDTVIGNVIGNMEKFDEEFREIAEKAFKQKVYVNPLERGNCSRFISHSCDPNMEIVRVFSGGLSPGNITVLFVSNRDIAANEELTFYYGSDYVKEHLGGNCLCDKCTMPPTEDEDEISPNPPKVIKPRTTENSKKTPLLRPASPETSEQGLQPYPDLIDHQMQTNVPPRRSTRVNQALLVENQLTKHDEPNAEVHVAVEQVERTHTREQGRDTKRDAGADDASVPVRRSLRRTQAAGLHCQMAVDVGEGHDHGDFDYPDLPPLDDIDLDDQQVDVHQVNRRQRPNPEQRVVEAEEVLNRRSTRGSSRTTPKADENEEGEVDNNMLRRSTRRNKLVVLEDRNHQESEEEEKEEEDKPVEELRRSTRSRGVKRPISTDVSGQETELQKARTTLRNRYFELPEYKNIKIWVTKRGSGGAA